MKFKTLRSSETGQNIAAIFSEMQVCRMAQAKLSKEIGFTQWRQASLAAFGGISCAIFDKPVDSKEWKKVHDGVYPKRNSRKGKTLEKKFATLPHISREGFNAAFGFTSHEAKFQKIIGCNFSNEDYFLFDVGDDWDYEAPEDCEEITVSEYEELKTK